MEDSKEKDNRITILLFVVTRVGKEIFRGFFPREKKKNFLATRGEIRFNEGLEARDGIIFFHANFDATEMDRSYAGNSIPYPVRKRGRFPGRCALSFDPIRGQRCMKLSSLLRDIAKQWTVSVQ